jgi:hypothetical protein
VGDCYEFTFQASVLEGTGAGLKVAPGATKVTFKAWSGGGGG